MVGLISVMAPELDFKYLRNVLTNFKKINDVHWISTLFLKSSANFPKNNETFPSVRRTFPKFQGIFLAVQKTFQKFQRTLSQTRETLLEVHKTLSSKNFQRNSRNFPRNSEHFPVFWVFPDNSRNFFGSSGNCMKVQRTFFKAQATFS